MINAKEELLEHIKDRPVEYVRVTYKPSHNKSTTYEGVLDSVINNIDFSYNNWYVRQQLFGTIWYADGSWSEREEYDGSEWWEHKYRPEINAQVRK